MEAQMPKQNRNFTSNDYYSNTWMMSHFPKYWYFMTIGSRGRGKTYSGKNYAIKYVLGQLEQDRPTTTGQRYKMDKNTIDHLRKFMWWRLTNDAVEKVKENSGRDFFEKQLLEKYGIRIRIVNSDIMMSIIECDLVNDDEEVEPQWFPCGKIASIQEYYKYKGNQLNDYDVIIMDELVRAESERRTFNIPKAFVNMIENVCRTRKGIRVMIYANAIGEMQEVKQLFGFMPLPGRFGCYKLYGKRAIIEYLDDSKEWKQEQAKTMAGVLKSNQTEFSNMHIDPLEDKDDFFIHRKDTSGKRYFMSLKIDRGLWLDIHSFKGIYFIDVSGYTSKKLEKSNRYALDRELVSTKTIYSKEIIKFIQEVWSVGQFRFSGNMAYKWFTEQCDKYNII